MLGSLGRRKTSLEERLGHKFKDLGLLELALTHRSWANEQGLEVNYERLEFLGDAVLGLVTAEWLYRTHPGLPEGDLSKKKATLVSEPALARHARKLGLGELLRVGVGEERSGGRDKDSLLSDALEAIFGALYLDGGFEAAHRIVEELVAESHEVRAEVLPVDAKTRLQEVTQAQGLDLPEYELIAQDGPDHDKVFTFACRVAGRVVGEGSGRSKKVAQQIAAAEALAALAARSEG